MSERLHPPRFDALADFLLLAAPFVAIGLLMPVLAWLVDRVFGVFG